MKNLLKKLKSKFHNQGSALVLVIVGLGFIGVLTGALITVVAFVYRQKLYDYNARDNFYYLEQAMDEIYAGIGSETTNQMQDAYDETLRMAVSYDPNTQSYKNIGDEKANKMFKNQFMTKIGTRFPEFASSDTTEKPEIVKKIESYISNSTVDFVPKNFSIHIAKDPDTNDVESVTLKDVTLSRTADYERSTARGSFTQTISTDIVIARPDFDVKFDTNYNSIDTLFDFSMVADSGVEVDKQSGEILTVNGNIYAASDFYNKKYNDYDSKNSEDYKKGGSVTYDSDGDSVTDYPMNKVSNYKYTDNNDTTTLVNRNQVNLSKGGSSSSYLYDGSNIYSKYSGLYINDTTVNVLASKVIVPGTIAVMNGNASLTLYGKNGTNVGNADVWADDLVLGGKSTTDADGNVISAPTALLNAKLYVKDDTQFEAEGSKFKLMGSYYGYSDSRNKDYRQFIPTTAKAMNASANIYQDAVKDASGNTVKDSSGNTVLENRGHFNSSAIIVNGENCSIDLTSTKNIYIAGRAYIELSKRSAGSSGSGANKVELYTYDSDTQDYKTGESVAIKSTQLAYLPLNVGTPSYDETTKEYWAEIPGGSNSTNTGSSSLAASRLFCKYFAYGKPADYPSGKAAVNGSSVPCIPVVKISAKNRKNGETMETTTDSYYIDFKYAADHDLYDKAGSESESPAKVYVKADANEADSLSESFVKDYFDCVSYSNEWDNWDKEKNTVKKDQFSNEHKDVDTNILQVGILSLLKKVTNYEDFAAGQIAVPDVENTGSSADAEKMYSSGVVTNSGNTIFSSDKNVDFSVTTSDQTVSDALGLKSYTNYDPDDPNKNTSDLNLDTSNVVNAQKLTDAYEKQYNYLKWTLDNQIEGSPDANFVDNTLTKKQTSSEGSDETTEFGEASITPINYYMNFDQLEDNTDIHPGKKTDADANILDLNEYRVWASGKDVHVTAEPGDNGVVTGIIIAKGDVYFDTGSGSSAVKQFNGIIITGGKIYINGNISSISSSLLCKNVINSCIQAGKETEEVNGQTVLTDNAKNAIKVLKLFKAYAKTAEELEKNQKADDNTVKTITNINYSDIMTYANWKKDVEVE